MNATRYFGEVQYKEAVKIENYRTLAKYFGRTSYMTPEPTTFPKAEIGLCGCGHNGTWYHQIIHLLP